VGGEREEKEEKKGNKGRVETMFPQ